MKSIKFHVVGTTPLMLNNPQMVNPLNKFAKQLKPLTSKRTKTDEDQEAIAHIKFLSSLYLDSNGHYIIPADHFWRSIQDAAKENKLGKKVERSLDVYKDAEIEFPDKDKSPEQLYELGEKYVDTRAVGIKNVKIVTTRAIIPEWSCDVEVFYDESQLNKKEIVSAFEIAGLRYGVGTYRRKFGKFIVKETK